MNEKTRQTRRDVLAAAAKTAGRAGLGVMGGCAATRDPDAEPLDLKIEQPDHYAASIAAFLHSVRTGEPVVSGVDNGRMATYTGLLVRKAVDERRWVQMSEIGEG